MSTHERSSAEEQVLRAQIRHEYEAYAPGVASHPLPKTPFNKLMFFNNMHLLFPVVLENLEEIAAMGFNASKDKKPSRDSNASHHSELYFSKVYGEFVNTVWEVIDVLGLRERANAACLKFRSFQFGQVQNPKDLEEIEDVFLRIYTELRLKGYTHYDITA